MAEDAAWAIQFMVEFQDTLLEIALTEIGNILDTQEQISKLDELWREK